MQNTRISWSESCVLVALCLGPAPAHAQFGFINNLLQPFMRSAERFFRSNTATNHTQLSPQNGGRNFFSELSGAGCLDMGTS